VHGSSLAKNAIIDEMENDYVLSEQTRVNFCDNYHLFTSFFGYHFDVIMSCLFKLRRLNSLRRLRHVFLT